MLCYHGKDIGNHSDTQNKKQIPPQISLQNTAEWTEICSKVTILHSHHICMSAVLNTYRITQNTMAM